MILISYQLSIKTQRTYLPPYCPHPEGPHPFPPCPQIIPPCPCPPIIPPCPCPSRWPRPFDYQTAKTWTTGCCHLQWCCLVDSPDLRQGHLLIHFLIHLLFLLSGDTEETDVDLMDVGSTEEANRYIRTFFHDCQKCTSLMVLMLVNVKFALVKLDKHAIFEIIICQT